MLVALLALPAAMLFATAVFAFTISDTVHVTAEVLAPVIVSGGGGGGGGGSAQDGSMVFEGLAYPFSRVVLLKDGQLAAQTFVGADARFRIKLTGLAAASYLFVLYSEDARGERSILYSIPAVPGVGSELTISGVVISPTIGVDKVSARQGDPISIFGYTAPDADVSVLINSSTMLVGQARSDARGVYVYHADTALLEQGSHSAKAKTLIGSSLFSGFSRVVNFQVVAQDEPIEDASSSTCRRGDLNCDGVINLIDFSILSYWYKRTGVPKHVDLSGDGIVSLVDFSILAYHWTG